MQKYTLGNKNKIDLFDHQVEGINFLTNAKKCILAHEMGLGKSRMAIITCGESGEGTLIVCPASLKINWQREINAVYPKDKVHVICNHDEGIGSDEKWVVINYDILERDMNTLEILINAGWVKNLILDEAQYIKGDSLRSKAIIGGRKMRGSGEISKFRGIAKDMERVICVTGTPIMNRPIELFNILKAIGHPLGSNKTEYAKRYCEMFLMYRIKDNTNGRSFVTTQEKFFKFYSNKDVAVLNRWPDMGGATNLDDLRRNLKGWMIRRKKSEVLDLPPKIKTIREAEMSPEWKKKYDNAWEDYLAFREANPIDDWNKENVIMARHLVEVGKLKQVCSLSKIGTIIKDIEDAVDAGEKVIVFSQYMKTIDAINDAMQELNIGVTVLTGDCDMAYRQASIDSFENDSRVKVFVSNIKAGGVGINLTAASIVMFADMDWSPEIHRQAEDRAHRLGQTGTVNIYYYIAPGTIEEDIIELLNKKQDTANQILEGSKRRISNKSVEAEFLKRMGNVEKRLDNPNHLE